jgi:hypothetical protein
MFDRIPCIFATTRELEGETGSRVTAPSAND